MTEEDVIRAMEICLDDDGKCSQCPFNGVDGCITKVEKYALALLSRYRKENARLMTLVESAPSEGGTKYADLISEIRGMQASYHAKTQKYKNYIPLSQYWRGREAEAQRIVERMMSNDR